MATVTGPRTIVECNEEESIVATARTEYIVSGLVSTTAYVVEEALGTAGVPQPASYFPGDYNLILCNRTAKVIDDTARIVSVVCEYRSIAEARATFIFSGGTSLTQITTQNDIYGNQLYVQHTFPADDPDPNHFPGEVIYQGGDVPVMIPQTTLSAVGRLPVDYPDEISRYWVGSLNSTYWAGSAPYTWLCTRCDFVGKDLALNRQHWWEFTWEFQFNPQGWIPVVFFTDPVSGKPPQDLVPAYGYKNVEWYGYIDYNELFPNT